MGWGNVFQIVCVAVVWCYSTWSIVYYELTGAVWLNGWLAVMVIAMAAWLHGIVRQDR